MPPPVISAAWINDSEFIEMLKYYEETKAFGKDYSKSNPVWQEISARAKLSAIYCRKKWLAIKHNYIKLKHMIRIGRVTEEMVRLNPKTAKYVDGRLNFLDRFLSEILDIELPKSVHSFFTSLFGETTDESTHRVDAVKLIKLKKKGNVIQVIQDYNQETGTEPTCILPNMEQEIKEEYSNDDDSNDIKLVAPVHQIILPTIQLHQDGPIEDVAKLQYITSNSIQPTTSDPIGDMVNFQFVPSSNIQSTTNDSIEDMATFQYITSCSIQPTTNDPIGDMASLQYVTARSIQSTTNDPIGDMANLQYVTARSIQPTTNDPIGDIANLQYVTARSIQPTTNDPIGDIANLQYITARNIQPTTNDLIGDMANLQYVRIQPKKNEEPNHKRKLGNQTNIEEPCLKRKPGRPSKNEELNKPINCNLARFLVKYTNTNIETEQAGDLKEYMDDLAEVLCNRLAPRKRKYFLSQIDLIVSEMLEG